MKKLTYILMVLVIMSLAVSCSGPAETVTPEHGEYWPTDGWRTSTPEEQGMDSALLDQITEYFDENNLDIHSVVVVRNGYIVWEEYPGFLYDQGMLHVVHSITKSFVSALIGIAIREGHIDGIDQKMTELFPDRTIQNLDERKEKITLEHLLTMKAGMEWDEWRYAYSDPQNHYIRAITSEDPFQYVLDTPMATDPGLVWNYNGGTSHLLSFLVTEATGQDTHDFAKKYLFEPLGITQSEWNRDKHGICFGGGELYLEPRDMAKFGYLYLNGGEWDGEQVVPADFVAASVKTQSTLSVSRGYGYQSWWTYPQLGVYDAAGLDGQRIYVVPELKLVVVVTSYIPESNDPEKWLGGGMMFQYIIPSCNQESSEVLPEE